MKEYECKYCKYITNRITNYKKHLLTRKHQNVINLFINTTNNKIVPINNDAIDIINHNSTNSPLITIIDDIKLKTAIIEKNMKTKIKKGYISDNYNCEFCDNNFLNKQHLRRHLLYNCYDITNKLKNEIIKKHNARKNTKNKLDLIIDNTNSEIHNSQTQLNDDIVKDKNITNKNITNKNITNNITINNNTVNNNKLVIEKICINGVGNESLNNLHPLQIKNILLGHTQMMVKYLNEIYKERANINAVINDRKKLIEYVNKDGDIENGEMECTLNIMVDIYFRKIHDLYINNKELLTPYQRERYESFWETYNETYYCESDDEDYMEVLNKDYYGEKKFDFLSNKFHKDIKLILLNKKYIANDNIKKLKKFKLFENNIDFNSINKEELETISQLKL
jgi:hypothetical protein